jgi:hypothetical protein
MPSSLLPFYSHSLYVIVVNSKSHQLCALFSLPFSNTSVSSSLYPSAFVGCWWDLRRDFSLYYLHIIPVLGVFQGLCGVWIITVLSHTIHQYSLGKAGSRSWWADTSITSGQSSGYMPMYSRTSLLSSGPVSSSHLGVSHVKNNSPSSCIHWSQASLSSMLGNIFNVRMTPYPSKWYVHDHDLLSRLYFQVFLPCTHPPVVAAILWYLCLTTRWKLPCP